MPIEPPESPPEPAACPRCGGPLARRPDYLADYAVRHRMPHIAAAVVLMCRSCRIAAANTPGVRDEWRGECPDLLDILARDSDAGIRQRRWMDAEPGDPILGWGW